MKIVQSAKFKKDLKRALKRGEDLQKLQSVIRLLVSGQALPPKNRNHPLTGNWIGWHDCHLDPDWILIYRITPEAIHLARTGTHSDLF